jgi:ubiquinone/menaquinone biosynthesis C-methylase UbiE/ADP-ribose pyrophosphatase YjhB (NUDIX family)
MPTITVFALLTSDQQVLLAQRRLGSPPFAGRWTLPVAILRPQETAEECLERLAKAELDVQPVEYEFADTLYLDDPAGGGRYVGNVFLVLRWEGKLRYRTHGEFQDVRWMPLEELPGLPMPEPMRRWLQARLAGEEFPQEPPDNRAAWNAIAAAYRARHRLPTDRLLYGLRCPSEDDLGLLGEVRGRRVLVLGCGGGEDAIALARRGAQVVGIDLSDERIRFARELAQKEGLVVPFVQGNIEELPDVDSESQDIVVSSHALNYVEHADRCFAEAFRVLKPGGLFVFSVQHPMDACLGDGPPYTLEKGYWQVQHDWEWEFMEAGLKERFRSWYRTVADWFALLQEAGFQVERLLEPQPPPEPPTEIDLSWGDAAVEKASLVPATLIFKARRPT